MRRCLISCLHFCSVGKIDRLADERTTRIFKVRSYVVQLITDGFKVGNTLAQGLCRTVKTVFEHIKGRRDFHSFETFGADVKTAREKLGISRRELAEKIGVDPRYLANIELNATIPSMPLVVQLFHLCRLPTEKYFNPELRKQETEQYQRVKYKVQLCPEKYLPAIESAIDELMKLDK